MKQTEQEIKREAQESRDRLPWSILAFVTEYLGSIVDHSVSLSC